MSTDKFWPNPCLAAYTLWVWRNRKMRFSCFLGCSYAESTKNGNAQNFSKYPESMGFPECHLKIIALTKTLKSPFWKCTWKKCRISFLSSAQKSHFSSLWKKRCQFGFLEGPHKKRIGPNCPRHLFFRNGIEPILTPFVPEGTKKPPRKGLQKSLTNLFLAFHISCQGIWSIFWLSGHPHCRHQVG